MSRSSTLLICPVSNLDMIVSIQSTAFYNVTTHSVDKVVTKLLQECNNVIGTCYNLVTACTQLPLMFVPGTSHIIESSRNKFQFAVYVEIVDLY